MLFYLELQAEIVDALLLGVSDLPELVVLLLLVLELVQNRVRVKLHLLLHFDVVPHICLQLLYHFLINLWWFRFYTGRAAGDSPLVLLAASGRVEQRGKILLLPFHALFEIFGIEIVFYFEIH